MLVGTSGFTINVHWGQRCECAVVGDEDEDPRAPEVSICWRDVSTDEESSAGVMLLRGADTRVVMYGGAFWSSTSEDSFVGCGQLAV